MLSRVGTTPAASLYRQHNESIHMTGGMTVMALFATPPKLDKSSHGLCMSHCIKPKSIAYLQWQITLHWKFSSKFRKWCKFSSHVRAKLHKKKSRSTGPARIFSWFLSTLLAIFSNNVWNRSYFFCLIVCNLLLYKIQCYLTTQLTVW